MAKTYNIIIAWQDGDDLDICGYFSSAASTRVGYGHNTTINVSGYVATWGGDNTTGGPESITVTVPDNTSQVLAFVVCANWFKTGDGHNGGKATVTISGEGIDTSSYDLNPSHNTGQRADTGDPSIQIVFGDGSDQPVVYKKYKVTVKVGSSGHPAVTVSGGGEYDDGASCTISSSIAAVNNGYNFDRWESDRGDVIARNPYTFTVDGNITWSAYYSQGTSIAWAVTNKTPAASSAHGSVTLYGRGTSSTTSIRFPNTGLGTCTIVATPRTGYVFARYELTYLGTTERIYADPYTFRVSHPVDVVAVFVRAYEVTVVADPQTGGAVEGSGMYMSGASCTIKATPANGWKFVRWQGPAGSVARTQTHTITVTANVTWTAYFRVPTGKVICTAAGVIVCKSSGEVLYDG